MVTVLLSRLQTTVAHRVPHCGASTERYPVTERATVAMAFCQVYLCGVIALLNYSATCKPAASVAYLPLSSDLQNPKSDTMSQSTVQTLLFPTSAHDHGLAIQTCPPYAPETALPQHHNTPCHALDPVHMPSPAATLPLIESAQAIPEGTPPQQPSPVGEASAAACSSAQRLSVGVCPLPPLPPLLPPRRSSRLADKSNAATSTHVPATAQPTIVKAQQISRKRKPIVRQVQFLTAVSFLCCVPSREDVAFRVGRTSSLGALCMARLRSCWIASQCGLQVNLCSAVTDSTRAVTDVCHSCQCRQHQHAALLPLARRWPFQVHHNELL